MTIRLHSIQVGQPQLRGAGDEAWESGIFKQAVRGPILLAQTNLAGDGQADLKNHGGPDKAVCAYSFDHYPYWQRQLATESPLTPGAFGENFTIAGLNEENICIGDSFAVGGAVVQVSQPRQPCWKLSRKWGIPTLARDVIQCGYTGWYLRVLEEGEVQPGDSLALLERPEPVWTIARANDVMYQQRTNREATQSLADLTLLADAWRDHLRSRAASIT